MQRVDEWLFGFGCSCAGCGERDLQAESQISLSAEAATQHWKPPPGWGDGVDNSSFAPRSLGRGGPPLSITPRQRDIRDSLQLPKLQMYPVPPDAEPGDTEEERRLKLLQMYQEVALDLHTGMYLTQLNADRDYADIHCQLMEDMTTLKLDQSNGRIIEFPLTNVSKVYRIVKSDDKIYTPGTQLPRDRAMKCEHIIVVEFLRRKLAFVYQEVQVAQRFMICMELLIRRAQQKQALRALTPSFPLRQASHGACPTPRQVYEAMSRSPCDTTDALSPGKSALATGGLDRPSGATGGLDRSL